MSYTDVTVGQWDSGTVAILLIWYSIGCLSIFLKWKTSVIILSFLCHHVEKSFTSGVYPYSNDWNSLKSSTKVKAIWIKGSQNMCCFRNINVINLPFLCYNSDNFGFVMSVYHIIHHTKILSWYVKFLLIYEDFYSREKKSHFFFYFLKCKTSVMILSFLCHHVENTFRCLSMFQSLKFVEIFN